MSARGPYKKGRARKSEILDVALDVIAREGYSGATILQLADEVGLSQNGLLHHFGSKDALFTQIVQHQDEKDALVVDAGHIDFASDLAARILEAVDSETASPGRIQLLLRLGTEATEPQHHAHEYFRARNAAVRQVIIRALSERQLRGERGAALDPEAVASLVFACWDGLRTQWLYDPSIDIRARMATLLSALGVVDARVSGSSGEDHE